MTRAYHVRSCVTRCLIPEALLVQVRGRGREETFGERQCCSIGSVRTSEGGREGGIPSFLLVAIGERLHMILLYMEEVGRNHGWMAYCVRCPVMAAA